MSNQSQSSAQALKPSKLLWLLLKPDSAFYKVGIIYSLAISLLTLSIPIAVQTLINTVANVGSTKAVVVLASLLCFLLLLSGLLSALRIHVMEFFERRLYTRLSAEVSLHTIYAQHEYFEGRRNTDITNRYFDIAVLQKNVPLLLVNGFALILQMLVGFTLVSFYHPAFLAFNIVIILTVLLIWFLWGRDAIKSAVVVSHAKYEMSKWLDSLAYAHEFFKSTRHIDYAVGRTDSLIGQYIESREQHFRLTFNQTLAFLGLYALASAALLGIGGWLVVIEELSLGQLVAAELILSAILYALSKAVSYLKLYYELCGAADELGQVLDVPQEVCNASAPQVTEASDLTVKAVQLQELSIEYEFDFVIPSDSKILVQAEDHDVQRALVYLLKRHLQPDKGWIQLAGTDLQDYDVYQLRQEIMVIDTAPIIECTVADYLSMACPGISHTQMRCILNDVGLYSRLQSLPEGINTLLSPTGAPLSSLGFLRLKLAAALLAKPKLLVLTDLFDLQRNEDLEPLLAFLIKQPLSLMFFSEHEHTSFDQCLVLNRQQQWLGPLRESESTEGNDNA